MRSLQGFALVLNVSLEHKGEAWTRFKTMITMIMMITTIMIMIIMDHFNDNDIGTQGGGMDQF